MIQSLIHKGEAGNLVGRYGYIVVDECRYVPAGSFALWVFKTGDGLGASY